MPSAIWFRAVSTKQRKEKLTSPNLQKSRVGGACASSVRAIFRYVSVRGRGNEKKNRKEDKPGEKEQLGHRSRKNEDNERMEIEVIHPSFFW